MRTITRSLPFTDKTEWAWPDDDTKLIQVWDWITDIDIIMRYVDFPKVCVQAGGACGQWPYRFGQLFDEVITFEPLPENRECLLANIEGTDNITVWGYALSDRDTKGQMAFDKSELNNSGAGYFKEGPGEIETTTIDSLELDRCDLIQLDIEGHELEALKGGKETITAFRPVVVLEEKPLPQINKDYKAPRKYLRSLGYREVDRMHLDVVFQC